MLTPGLLCSVYNPSVHKRPRESGYHSLSPDLTASHAPKPSFTSSNFQLLPERDSLAEVSHPQTHERNLHPRSLPARVTQPLGKKQHPNVSCTTVTKLFRTLEVLTHSCSKFFRVPRPRHSHDITSISSTVTRGIWCSLRL
jgi:hypothetical protein